MQPQDFFPKHIENQAAEIARAYFEAFAARVKASVLSGAGIRVDADETLPQPPGQSFEITAKGLDGFVSRKIGKITSGKTGNKIAVSRQGTIVTDQMMKGFVQKSVEQLTELSAEYVQEVTRVVQIGIDSGRVSSLVDDLAKISDTMAARAEFRARDIVGDVFSEMTKAKAESAGFPGYIWMTSLDARVRDSHADLHGRYFKWGEKVPGLSKPGATKFGEDYLCRCSGYPSFGPDEQMAPDERAADIEQINAARRRQGLEEVAV